MGFIDIFNYKKYFKVKSDATVARVGHVNAVYNALQSGIVGPQGPKGDTGPAGPAGPAVPSGLNWMGAYDAQATYDTNDVVTWTNPNTEILGSYWVTDGPLTGTAPTNGSGVINSGWAFLASQGPAGTDGITSINGIIGAVTAAVASKTYTSNNLNLTVTPSGQNLNFRLNEPYKSVVGILSATATTTSFTVIANNWGNVDTSNFYVQNNIGTIELKFADSFANKPVTVQITAANSLLPSKKFYSSENDNDTRVILNMTNGTAGGANTTLTQATLNQLRAFVEIRFYNV